MKPSPEPILPFVDELVALLDLEASVLETRCTQLESLATAALQRNGEAMDETLGWIEQTQLEQARVDRQLESVRKTIADIVDVPIDRLRLAWLAGQLPAAQSAVLTGRRGRIIELTERLQRRHMETAVVITECARVNGMLLESLCPSMHSVTTYGASGESSRRWGNGLVDVES